ncbi:MAG: hypothetical protein SPI83_01085 [Rothia sp. (in: high G+C Gram-positive bacteria)]|nr:hypothetical protein [Rothia sp. (in: high G+C Gram-positive bacteria)]
MTESHRDPAPQGPSHQETQQAVGSDVIWVRLRIDRDPAQANWPDLIPGIYGDGPTQGDKQQEADASEQPALPAGLEQEVRNQLESIIGLIREQTQEAPHGAEYTDEDIKSVEELAADPNKFDDLIQQIMQAEQGSGNQAEESPRETGEIPDEELETFAGELSPEAQAAIDELNWEIIPDLAGYIESLATVTALEIDGPRAQLFVLCERIPGQASLRTVETDSTGVLLPGASLDEFLTQLDTRLPGAADLLPQQPGEDYHLASFSQGTDSLSLDPYGVSAALVELPMADIASYMQPELMVGEVHAAPADKGWSLITADPQTLALLLEAMNVPSIVAEQTLFGQNLSFVLPADSTGPETGSVTDWVNQVMGTPDSGLVGTVLTFSWSPLTKIGTALERTSSEVGNLVWSLPGLLPAPYREQGARDQLDQLIWLYGLDDQTANRLTNYVLDFHSLDGLESTIHALELPEELHKVLTGSVSLDAFVGYRRFTPDMSGLERLKESVTAYPNGTDTLSTVNREIREHPWLLTADAAAQLGASGALALWAARRMRQGRSPRAALVAAATLGATGTAEMVIARVYYRLLSSQKLPVTEHHQTRPLSLTEELRAQAQQEQAQQEQAQKDSEAKAPALMYTAQRLGRRAENTAQRLGLQAAATAQRLGRQAGKLARQQLGRFFGTGS